jgi:hypothetical protein
MVSAGVDLTALLGSKLIQEMLGQLENALAAVFRRILTKTTGNKGHLKVSIYMVRLSWKKYI